MEHEVKLLRDAGHTWKDIANILEISVSTAKRKFKKSPDFPRILEGKIYRKVPNPRLIWVELEDEIITAVITPGNHRPGTKVRVEQLDKKNYRVLRN